MATGEHSFVSVLVFSSVFEKETLRDKRLASAAMTMATWQRQIISVLRKGAEFRVQSIHSLTSTDA